MIEPDHHSINYAFEGEKTFFWSYGNMDHVNNDLQTSRSNSKWFFTTQEK